MEDKINEILEKLKKVYMDFFSEPEKTLSEAEKRFKEPLPYRPIWRKAGGIMGRSPDGNGKTV